MIAATRRQELLNNLNFRPSAKGANSVLEEEEEEECPQLVPAQTDSLRPQSTGSLRPTEPAENSETDEWPELPKTSNCMESPASTRESSAGNGPCQNLRLDVPQKQNLNPNPREDHSHVQERLMRHKSLVSAYMAFPRLWQSTLLTRDQYLEKVGNLK